MSVRSPFWSSILSKSVYVPRQKRWKISPNEPKVNDLKAPGMAQQVRGAKCAKASVRCLLIRNKKINFEKRSLLIHIHGGGFISQSPEFHQVYLNDWLHKMPGIVPSPECNFVTHKYSIRCGSREHRLYSQSRGSLSGSSTGEQAYLISVILIQ
jgi:hypothetical protein